VCSTQSGINKPLIAGLIQPLAFWSQTGQLPLVARHLCLLNSSFVIVPVQALALMEVKRMMPLSGSRSIKLAHVLHTVTLAQMESAKNLHAQLVCPWVASLAKFGSARTQLH